MKVFICALVFFSGLIIDTQSFSATQCRQLKEDVQSMQSKDPVHFPGSAVRLAFHEAATYSPPSTSGLDGCVLEDSPANAGLVDLIKELDELREKPIYQGISRSDFWVFCATYALDLAAKPTGSILGLTDEFKWGRIDLDSCEGDSGQLVGPGADGETLFREFTGRLMLTTKDIVAIMGGHSVGKADENDSGFEGSFDSTPAIFDNTYYRELLQKQWERTSTGGGRPITFWKNHEQGTMLFHTDATLAYGVGAQNATCHINMGDDLCPLHGHGNSREYVEEFSESLWSFFVAFREAWGKVMTLGYDCELKPINYC